MLTRHRAGTVSAGVLLGLALTLTVAHIYAPHWSRRIGLDIWNLNTAVTNLQRVYEDAARLRIQEEQWRQEYELADTLAAMLVTGNISLAEATDLLQPNLQSRPGFDVVAFVHYKAPTLRHGVARYLIARISWHLCSSPIQYVITTTRLEAEYAAMR
jgi:hypothetical protein